MNFCISCGKEISKYANKCRSCGNKGRISWNTGLTKETDERLKRVSDANKRLNKGPKSEATKEKIRKAIKERWKDPKMREKISVAQSIAQKKRYENPKEREKQSYGMKEYLKDPKNREKHSCKMKEYFKDPKNREEMSYKLKKVWENPSDKLLSTIGTGFGIACYSDNNLFFASLQERDCYYWLRDVLKVNVKKFGRFDFIINDEIVLEYHPCNWLFEKRSHEEYYKDRRKLLDNMGYKYLKLIVMLDLNREEKERIKKLFNCII